MRDPKYRFILQLLLVAACVVSFKFYYASASVNDLRWLLEPTTIAVETFTGTDFTFESYSGYMKDDKTFLIAASCAGGNFLIASFLLISIGGLWPIRHSGGSWFFLIGAGIGAYFVTIIANTVRISTALRLREVPAETGWFNDSQLHRIEGITIYFGFLMLIYLIISMRITENDRLHKRSHWRSALLPLGIYYLTTLGLPLANGAYKQGAVFLEHLLFVITVPLLIVLPWIAIRYAAARYVARRNSRLAELYE